MRAGIKHGIINALSDVEAAYLAGLVDADGTITLTVDRCRVPRPLLLVVNSELELIEWILLTVGAGCAYQTKTRPTRPDQNAANWNPVHRYQLTSARALALVERIRPWLRVKHRHADLVLQMPIRGRDYSARCPAELLLPALEIVPQIRALNRRGLKPQRPLRPAI